MRSCIHGEKAGQESRPISAYPEDVVLVKARIDRTVPDRASAEFVEVAALCHEKVPSLKGISADFIVQDPHMFDVGRVDAAVLNICNPKIWQLDGAASRK